MVTQIKGGAQAKPGAPRIMRVRLIVEVDLLVPKSYSKKKVVDHLNGDLCRTEVDLGLPPDIQIDATNDAKWQVFYA